MEKGSPRRVGCLFVVDFPLAALLRAETGLSGVSVAVTDGRGGAIIAASREAREAGVSPGMTEAAARGLLPDLVLRPFSPAQVRSAQSALLDVARSFSPRVALEPGGEVCLDLEGLRSLYPPERRLGAALQLRTCEAGLPAQVGIAATRFCARMAARTATDVQVVPAGGEQDFLAGLPVGLLDIPCDLHAQLRRFGIECLGQLAGLPAEGLSRRLGPAGLRLWRLARGGDPEPLVSTQAPERFIEEAETGYPIDRVEPLLFVLQGVLQRLAERLAFRGLSAQRLFLSLGLDPAGCDERALDLAAPTGESRTWLAVLRLVLEESPPPAPVTALVLEAAVVPTRRTQMDLFLGSGPPPAKLGDAIARLSALCGEDRVGSPRVVDSWRPEDFALVPFGSGEQQAGLPRGREALLRAIRPAEQVEILQEGRGPARLRGGEVRGRVLQFAGPWRLSGGWWEQADLNRDYYEVALSDGGVYRIYQERGTGQWFLDGICG